MSEALGRLADALRRDDGLVLVVTGAGVSLASGIPTFRGTDKDAVWKKDVTELGTFHYFCADPAGSWRWYLGRFAALEGAEPNDGHRALVELERWCGARGREFLLVTQNIDNLHARAGSERLVEVHGSSRHARCSRDSCELGAPRGMIPQSDVDLSKFRAEPVATHLPQCPRCGALLRQHVLWFDEYYTSHDGYQWYRVTRAAALASLVIFVGTSFAVGVTELVLTSARRRGIPTYSIDPAGTAIPGVLPIAEPSEVALVDLMRSLA